MLNRSHYALVSMHAKRFARPVLATCAIHTCAAKRSVAAMSPQEKPRTNLNVIDFFHPSLSSTLFHYTLNLGVSGYPKAGKPVEQTDDLNIYSSVQVGDDAYFKRQDALGVADGVGGWRSHKGELCVCLYDSMVYLLLFLLLTTHPQIIITPCVLFLLHLGANPALYSRKLMHYAQVELDRIKTNVRPQQLQAKPDPVQVLESAYHMTTLDAQNEV